eukprot:c4106_g1_i1.p1 GENE.c4106_g1_i1~~c4106_g1_i1.p1  ORF type:complete len:613 (+),score=61.70 c4106_g1_i1:24-1841(+)
MADPLLYFEVEVMQGMRSLWKQAMKCSHSDLLWRLLQNALGGEGATEQDITNSVWEVELAPNSQMKTQRTVVKREDMDMPLQVVSDTFKANYICFHLVEDLGPTKRLKIGPSSFEVVSKFDSDYVLPDPISIAVTPTHRLYNVLLLRLQEHQLGWPADSEFLVKRSNQHSASGTTEAETIIHYISHVLYNLWPKWETLQANTQFLSGPDAELFTALKPQAETDYLGLSLDTWSADTYQHWATLLQSNVLSEPCIKVISVALLEQACAHVYHCLCDHVRLLKRARLAVVTRPPQNSGHVLFQTAIGSSRGPDSPSSQDATEPVNTVIQPGKLTTIECNHTSAISRLKCFKDLEECLQSNECYQVINLSDVLSDASTQRRQNIVSDLRVHGLARVAFQMVEYEVSSGRPCKLTFAWRIPTDLDIRDSTMQSQNQIRVLEAVRASFSPKPGDQTPTDESLEDAANKKMFIGSNVRATVQCTFCGKPRIVFAWAKDWKAHTAALQKVLEESRYTCGSLLVPPSSPLAKIFVVKRAIRCDEPLQKLYYSQKNISVPVICFHCGGSEEVTRDPELLSEYKCVFPQCKECRNRKVTVIKTHYKKKGGHDPLN